MALRDFEWDDRKPLGGQSLKTKLQVLLKLGLNGYTQQLNGYGSAPTPTRTPTAQYTPPKKPTPTLFNPLIEDYLVQPTPTNVPTEFGSGQDVAHIEPKLFDRLMKIEDVNQRLPIAELSGQESSYGYAPPHITEKEQSYGPYHINIMAGRKNPNTGKPFTQKEAEDIDLATQYALDEMLRTGGLGAWNPGAFDFYQKEIPERAKKKKYIRGKEAKTASR